MEGRDNSRGRGKGEAIGGGGGRGRGRGRGPWDEQTSQPIGTSHPTNIQRDGLGRGRGQEYPTNIQRDEQPWQGRGRGGGGGGGQGYSWNEQTSQGGGGGGGGGRGQGRGQGGGGGGRGQGRGQGGGGRGQGWGQGRGGGGRGQGRGQGGGGRGQGWGQGGGGGGGGRGQGRGQGYSFRPFHPTNIPPQVSAQPPFHPTNIPPQISDQPPINRGAMANPPPQSARHPIPGNNAPNPPKSYASVVAAPSRKESGPESGRARCAPVRTEPTESTHAVQSRSLNCVSQIRENTQDAPFSLNDSKGKNDINETSCPPERRAVTKPESSSGPVPWKKLEANQAGTNGPVLPLDRPADIGKKCSRRVDLVANHFHVDFKECQEIWHYDLGIIKLGNREVTIKNRELCVEILKELLTQHAGDFPRETIVHDGKNNMYSSQNLEPRPQPYPVTLVGAENANINYNVTVKHTHSIKGESLRTFLFDKTQHGVNFKDFQDFLHGLELVIREHPSDKKLLVGRSLYQLEQGKVVDDHGGNIACEGFYQSLRPTAKGLALVVDFSVGTFYNHIPVIDYLKSQTIEWKESEPLSQEQRRNAEKALKGLKIKVNHRPDCSQKYTVRGLTQEKPENIRFSERRDDINQPERKVTIKQYFLEKYGHAIFYKELPCLDLGKYGSVPMELCELCAGQRVPHRDMVKTNLKIYSPSPQPRRGGIIDYMISPDGPAAGHFVRSFHLNVLRTMTKVTGRVLQVPTLNLKRYTFIPHNVNPKWSTQLRQQVVPTLNRRGHTFIPRNDNPKWSTQLIDYGVFDGKPIENWCVMVFSSSNVSSAQKECVKNFTFYLVKRCLTLGIEMNKEPLQETKYYTMDHLNNVTFLEQTLSNVLDVKTKTLQSPIVICVIEKKHPAYNTLKLIAETKIGLVTQCCLYRKIENINDYNSPYLMNLALKMNAKMGGSNSALDTISIQIPRLGESRVMYIGADVNHPNPGINDSPSVAAVVGSINWPKANRYIAKIRYQKCRNEQIEQLKDMSKELLDNYYVENKETLPDSIIFFRDGVSEGQFEMVLTKELSALKEAASLFQNYKPRISIIVAQKRHHTRLFLQKQPSKNANVPGEVEDANVSAEVERANVPAGTVVDTEIVHPHQFDFYLCSHYAPKGTSRPTHYHVLMDENKFTADELQGLINNLCYTFQRCTNPVSLVPPVYYADLAAYRGRCYLHALSYTAENAPNFPTVHHRVNNTMFFC